MSLFRSQALAQPAPRQRSTPAALGSRAEHFGTALVMAGAVAALLTAGTVFGSAPQLRVAVSPGVAGQLKLQLPARALQELGPERTVGLRTVPPSAGGSFDVAIVRAVTRTQQGSGDNVCQVLLQWQDSATTRPHTGLEGATEGDLKLPWRSVYATLRSSMRAARCTLDADLM